MGIFENVYDAAVDAGGHVVDAFEGAAGAAASGARQAGSGAAAAAQRSAEQALSAVERAASAAGVALDQAFTAGAQELVSGWQANRAGVALFLTLVCVYPFMGLAFGGQGMAQVHRTLIEGFIAGVDGLMRELGRATSASRDPADGAQQTTQVLIQVRRILMRLLMRSATAEQLHRASAEIAALAAGLADAGPALPGAAGAVSLVRPAGVRAGPAPMALPTGLAPSGAGAGRAGAMTGLLRQQQVLRRATRLLRRPVNPACGRLRVALALERLGTRMAGSEQALRLHRPPVLARAGSTMALAPARPRR